MITNHHKSKLIVAHESNKYIHGCAKSSNAGFTLVELMIALVLGLLVSAAALQVFYTSSVNARRQEASSQIQDNATFGWSQIQQHIRRANYGAKPIPSSSYDQYYMNHLTPQGGIVLTAPTVAGAVDNNTPGGAGGNAAQSLLDGNLSGLVLDGQAIPSDLLTTNQSSKSSSNIKGISNSDQLTIQYQVAETGVFNCEGTSVPQGFYVIERYFVRDEGLACASAIYDYDETAAGSSSGIDIKDYTVPGETDATPNALAGDGSIIIPNVDYFRILLGISSNKDFATEPSTARIAYIPVPSDPTSLSNNRIFGVQVGILTRSNNPMATNQTNGSLRFNILDKRDQALKDTVANGATNLRTVFETTVLIRNARGGV